MLLFKCMSASSEIALKWMSQNTIDDKSTLVWVMTLCHQATNQNLSHCWPRTMSPYSITRPQWVKLLYCVLIWHVPWWPLLGQLSCQVTVTVWCSGTCRFHLRVPNLQMGCRDLNTWQGTRRVAPTITARCHVPLETYWKWKGKVIRKLQPCCTIMVCIFTYIEHGGIPQAS